MGSARFGMCTNDKHGVDHPGQPCDICEPDAFSRYLALRRMQSHAIATRLRSLGAALVQAAALTRAWKSGAQAYKQHLFGIDYWTPGCGREVP